MTDKELIARLRQHDGWVTIEAHTHLTAADRIEQLAATCEELVKERDGLLRVVTDNHVALQRAEYAEAKLAKAVEVMKSLQEDMLERSRAGMDTIHGEEYRIVNAGRTAWNDFCATLAELEGEKK